MGRLSVPTAVVAFALVGACGDPDGRPIDAGTSSDAIGDGWRPIDAYIIDPGPPICTPPPPPPTSLPASAAAAGSRLIPRVLAEPVSGGLEVPFGVYDSVLGVSCRPTNYADMKVRCVPRETDVHKLPDKRWADAAKTIPVALEGAVSPPPQGTLAGYFTTTQTCWWLSVELARIGSARQETTYYDSNGAHAVPSGYALFGLTPVPTTFVELTEQLVQFDAAIAGRELHGSDGSRLFVSSLYDTTHDVPVEAYGNMTNGYRLLPPALELKLAHRMYPPVPSCGPVDYVFSAVTEGKCDATGLRYARDASGFVYQVVGQYGTLWYCVHYEDGTSIQQVTGPFLGICSSMPTSAWAPASAVTIGSRITAAAYGVGNATYVGVPFEWHLRDTTLGIDCTPRLGGDGVLRCLPLYNIGGVVYSDSACTSRAIHDANNTATYAEEGSIDGLGLAGNVTVYTVGAARPAGTLYARTPAGCTLAFNNEPSYEVGAVVPASTFAALTVSDVP